MRYLALISAACVLSAGVLRADGPATQSAGDAVTSTRIDKAVDAGVAWVLARQVKSTGGWADEPYPKFAGGQTALAAWTLANVQVTVADERVAAAVNALAKVEMARTYSRAFRLMALARLAAATQAQTIRADVAWLADRQNPNDGGWGYGNGDDQRWTDASNSQLAVLALWEASKAGFEVPERVWMRAQGYWLKLQGKDGGFAYHSNDKPSDGSMTAAALASLYVLTDQFRAPRSEPCRGDAVPSHYPQADAALAWLAKHFDPAKIAGRADDDQQWLNYYLYAVERVGVAGGLATIGRHDWFAAGAARLLADQRDDGSWGGNLVDTCFALLFLVNGRAPTVIAKINVEGADALPRDAAGLTQHLSQRFEKAMRWQLVDADSADLADAPILYHCIDRTPQLDKAWVKRMQAFIDGGGTAVLAAGCVKSENVATAANWLNANFPQYHGDKVPADHPVYNWPHKRAPGNIWHMHDAARSRIFLVADPAALAWHRGDAAAAPAQFHLAANLFAYATYDTPLRPRTMQPPPAPAGRPRATLTAGRLKYGGDWNVEPAALANLADLARREHRLGVEVTAGVTPGRDDLSKFDLLWLAGYGFKADSYTDGQWQKLRQWVEGGGTLVIDIQGGLGPQAMTLQTAVFRTFGKESLFRAARDHALIAGRPGGNWTGQDVWEVAYRRDLALRKKDDRHPSLYFVPVGEGRRAGVIFSPFDITTGLADTPTYGCIGYAPKSSRAIATNILLYVAAAKK